MTATNFNELPVSVQDFLIESLRGLPFLRNSLRHVFEELDPMIYCNGAQPFIAPEYAEAFFISLIKNQSQITAAT